MFTIDNTQDISALRAGLQADGLVLPTRTRTPSTGDLFWAKNDLAWDAHDMTR